MSGSLNVGEKYSYNSLHVESMDKIQKRKGYIRTFTAAVIVASIVVQLYYRRKRIGKTKEVLASFTSGQIGDTSKIQHLLHISVIFSLWIIVFVVTNFLHRICLLSEELFHRKTRYNGSYKKLLTAVFFGSWNKIYFLLSILVIGLVCYWDYNVLLHTCQSHIDMLAMTVVILLPWFTFKRWSDIEFEHNAACAPSIGIAMAYGIYYNYYEHVLEGLKERIQEAEKQYGITIPLKKLILLFPSSGVNMSHLDGGNDDLDKVGELPAVEKDDGGTMDRKRTNPIYKVFPKNASPFFCVVEGINCLSTLKTMNLSEQVFREQAYLLYISLKDILDHSRYKNSYVILCYDDDNEDERLSTHLWNSVKNY